VRYGHRLLAPAQLPASAHEFNRRHGAPFGRRGHVWFTRARDHSRLAARLAGPYAWQPNNSTRRFEYPWVYEQVRACGDGLVVADVGASLAGMQFTLASEGYQVHAVDPAMAATGRGWELDPAFHAFLCRAYDAPVTLHPTTLDGAGLPEASVDVLLSVSTLEHFGSGDFAAFAESARRVLKPGAAVVLTVDLFLDLAPFTDRAQNQYGINVDVARLLDDLDCDLAVGSQAELHGFPEFDPRRVQADLSDYLLGEGYPAMAQCVVGRRRRPPGL
jgi:SAM-dependent methyltransferase